MRRPPAGVSRRPRFPLLLLLTLLIACPIKSTDKTSGEDPVDTGKGDTDHRDSGDSADSGDELLSPPDITAWVSVNPATLPGAKGGEMSVLAAVTPPKGGLSVYTDPAYVFTVDLGKSTPVVVTVDGDFLVFTFTVPPALDVDGGRAGHALSLNGVAFAEVPVALSADINDVVAAMVGTSMDIVPGDEDAICGTWMTDSDGDGVVEFVTLGIEDTCYVTARACAVDGSGCEESMVDACLGHKETVFCGSTDHFKTDGGDDQFTMAAFDVDGKVMEVGGFVLGKGGWTGAGEKPTETGLPAIVLDVSSSLPRGKRPRAPIHLLERTDTLEGYFIQGGEAWTFTNMGDVTTKAIAGGTGWAGLFGTTDLSGGTEGEDSWGWALTLTDKGVISGSVLAPDMDAKAFATVRTFRTNPPPFTIEFMTASGEDLDGDGHPELFLEAWGEGRHTTWVVMAATDKSDTREIRTLAQPCGAESDPDEGCTWAVSVRGDEDLDHKVAESSLVANARVVSVTGFLVDDHANPLADRVASTVVAVEWDIADIVVDDATSVEGSGTSIIGEPSLKTTPSSCNGRGQCFYGKCYCTPYYSGEDMVVGGGGSGTDIVDAPLEVGDLVYAGPDPTGTSVILRRSLMNTDFPNAEVTYRAHYGTEDVSGGRAYELAGMFVNPRPKEMWEGSDSRISVTGGNFEAHDNSQVLMLSEGNISTGGMTVAWFDDEIDGVRYPLPADTTSGGATHPTLLSTRRSTDNGALITWRDGKGQVWIGLADIDSAMSDKGEEELPFLEGPFALGKPVLDTGNLLGLSVDRSGAVGIRQQMTGRPFLNPNDYIDRYIDDSVGPPKWSCEDNCLDAVAVVVGSTGACPFETMYLPAAETLAEMIAAGTVRYSSSDKTCSDLPVPLLSFTPVADVPQFVLLRLPDGRCKTASFDDVGQVAGGPLGPNGGTEVESAREVSAGDVNGDGLSDLFVVGTAESGAQLLLSDGRGGFTDSSVEASVFTNFALLLGPTSGKDVFNDEGGLPLTLGRSVYLDGDDYPN